MGRDLSGLHEKGAHPAATSRTSPRACRIIHQRMSLIPVRNSCHSNSSSNVGASASYALRLSASSTAVPPAVTPDEDFDLGARVPSSPAQCGHSRGIVPSMVPYPTAAPMTAAAAPPNAPAAYRTGRMPPARLAVWRGPKSSQRSSVLVRFSDGNIIIGSRTKGTVPRGAAR